MSNAVSQEDIAFITEVMNSSYGTGLYGYVDRETGEVFIGSEDCPLDILPDEDDENYEQLAAEFARRYVPIPHDGSQPAYQDMLAFIDTVEDKHLQDLLSVAVQGTAGVFGRFKNVLRRSEYGSEWQRWGTFSEMRESDRAVQWLAVEGLSVED